MFFTLFRRSHQAKEPKSRPNDPELKMIWDRLVVSYFPDRVDLFRYEVTWSKRRQRRVLGSCNVRFLKVRIAQELSHPEAILWLEPVLYHELCHAFLGLNVVKHRGKRAWHGPQFKALEARHPGTEGMKRWMKSGGWRRVSQS